MKKIIFVLGFFLICFQGFSQPTDGKNENFKKYQSMKVSYMTEKLSLTPEEAQAFWPIYNEFDKKRFEIHEKAHDLEKTMLKNFDTLSEKDFEKYNKKMVNQGFVEANLWKEYNDKLLKILSAKKVVMIGNVEKDFRFKMLREYRGKDNRNSK